jgi:hypothetical protein
MSEYQLSIRRHDAEWILHRERTYNDRLLQQARRRRTRTTPRRDTDNYFDTQPDPQAQAQAALVLAGTAAAAPHIGADGLRQALTILGILTDPPAQQQPKPATARQYGWCRTCQRGAIPLRRNGQLTAHATKNGRTSAEDRCPGSHTNPIKRRNAA